MTFAEVINEINQFTEDFIEKGKSIQDDRIEIFEEDCGYKLPEDFRLFMKTINGLMLNGNVLLPFKTKSEKGGIESYFEIYKNHIPKGYIPISPDGAGNVYCLCFDPLLAINRDYVIIFWQHNYLYTDNDPPEVCNTSFGEFIKEVFIDWTLEDYYYDGRPKI